MPVGTAARAAPPVTRLAGGRRLLGWAAVALFAGYVGLLVVAGAWGAFGGARLDQRWLFDLDVDRLPPATAAALLGQYRFLRAIELGFGVFAIRYRREIFADHRFGHPFVAVMAAGVLARIQSMVLDGHPTALFTFFLVSEALGVVAISVHARPRWAAASP